MVYTSWHPLINQTCLSLGFNVVDRCVLDPRCIREPRLECRGDQLSALPFCADQRYGRGLPASPPHSPALPSHAACACSLPQPPGRSDGGTEAGGNRRGIGLHSAAANGLFGLVSGADAVTCDDRLPSASCAATGGRGRAPHRRQLRLPQTIRDLSQLQTDDRIPRFVDRLAREFRD